MKNMSIGREFVEKRFVNVSVLESNIRAKKGTYYGRVCHVGHLNMHQVLQIVKDRSPYIDVAMVESALEKIADVIFDMAAQGYSVDFGNLGTFSLATKGKIEMTEKKLEEESLESLKSSKLKPAKPMYYVHDGARVAFDAEKAFMMEDFWQERLEELEENEEGRGNYDVSECVRGGVNFAFKFLPSKALKASMKNIKMNLAIRKNTNPVIERVENALPERREEASSVLKVSGKHLKIVGEDERVGIYIEKKKNMDVGSFSLDSLLQEKTIGKPRRQIVKIERSSLIQNEDKTLTVLLEGRLEKGVKYCITIVTQAGSGGKMTSKLRHTQMEFVYE